MDDCFDSLLNQTIGYSKIQIILVNDGSLDSSENISLEYKSKFRSNIIYIKIKHSGVSIARNIGLKYASGKYINFLDSDDKWDYKSLRYSQLFFKFHKNIDIISARIKYFESSNRYHYLDYKFKKTRVVNLSEEYSHIQLSVSSSFFRFSSIKRNKFDENIFIGEDVKFLNNILIFKPLIGFVRDAIYNYRKRNDNSSSMQNKRKIIDNFLSEKNFIQKYLIDKSNSLNNNIIPFIQFYLSYDILFKISSPSYKILDLSNYYKYCNLIQYFVNHIEDKYIMEQRIFSNKLKIIALSNKYNHDIRYDFKLLNQSILYYLKLLFYLNIYITQLIWGLHKSINYEFNPHMNHQKKINFFSLFLL